MRFRDKIDNVNRPFVPCIRYKPNAMKTLEGIMYYETYMYIPVYCEFRN